MNEQMQPVAAVCGSQVRIYGAVHTDRHGKDYRPLQRTIDFPHYGAAVLYAQEHDEVNAKPVVPPRRY